MSSSLRNRIFVSYSHKDLSYLEALKPHLETLERLGPYSYWADERIQPGTDWRKELGSIFSTTRVAILLVSQYFLASEFIRENELPPLLRAAEDDGALILPVIVSPCLFSRIPELSRYQAVNASDLTVREMNEIEREKTWVHLCEVIVDAVAGGNLDISHEPLSVVRTGHVDQDSLDIVLEARRAENGEVLFYMSLKSEGSRNERIYTTNVRPDHFDLYRKEALRNIENLAHEKERPEVVDRRLEALSVRMVRKLMPEELMEDLASLHSQYATLKMQIISDELFMAWEALRLSAKREVGARALFLSEAFELTRGVAGHYLPRSLSLKKIACVAPASSGLPSKNSEIDLLRSVAKKQGGEVVEIKPEYLDVMDALASGSFDCFHFIAHSAAYKGSGLGDGFISLDDGELTATDLSVVRQTEDTRPLVFVGGEADSGLVNAFVEAGAGAVIFSNWSVYDSSIAQFGRVFYERLVEGETLGAAVRLARLKLREVSSDASWLSFAALGDPLARCR